PGGPRDPGGARPGVRPLRNPVVSLPDSSSRRAACQYLVLPVERRSARRLRMGDEQGTERSAAGGGRLVAFLGGGRMGEALVSGLIRSGGRRADEIRVTARRQERADELSERLGVGTT